MNDADPTARLSPFVGISILLLGLMTIALGWALPSRFKSVPQQVAMEAGAEGDSIVGLARDYQTDENLGAAAMLFEAASQLEIMVPATILLEMEDSKADNPQVERWGAWDPFLEAAFAEIPLEQYSEQPGLLGIVIGKQTRPAAWALLANSRNPLVKELLASGSYTTYKRLFPVSSVSGQPLEATLLALGFFAQGERFTDAFKGALRYLLAEAKATGDVGALEDLYLDTLSLIRLYNWGQMKALLSHIESADELRRLRYMLHRKADQQPVLYAMALAGERPAPFLDYLAKYGDAGFDALRVSLAAGLDGFRLVVREGLPVERMKESESRSIFAHVQNRLVPFSLKHSSLALILKYGSFFAGAFVCLWGGSLFGRFYRERTSATLALTQRFFGASALALVFAVLSEPYLAHAGDFQGYSFRFVMPLLTIQDGEVILTQQEPTFAMEPATLLSIAFFFLLQILVFLICLLKVREIDRRDVDDLVKLRLMENEENLFDTGLYVGIAGTCISLVLQVIGVVEANLLAAYSSNLFGILSVAIVKIRLVRPYKTRLIIASEDRIADMSSKIA